MTAASSDLYAMWSRAGVMFAQPPASATPDIEQLVLQSVQSLWKDSRLADAAFTWLSQYHQLVAKHRLRRMLVTTHAVDHAVLGLLLSSVREQARTDRFSAVIELCEPAGEPRPLYAIHQDSAALARLAERTASDLSRRWRRWAPRFELRLDILRPATWVMQHNPTWRQRADFKGDLRASIVEELRTTPDAGESELALARRCGVTRSALRVALGELEVAARIQRARTRHRAGVALLPDAAGY